MMHSYITDEAFPVAESVNVVATERNLKKCFEPTLRPVNVATEGSTQVAPMCASCVLPKKVGKIV